MPHTIIKTLTAECPECQSDVMFESTPHIDQIVNCDSCGTKLEVAYLFPIMLDWADDDALQVFEDDYDDFDYNSAYS